MSRNIALTDHTGPPGPVKSELVVPSKSKDVRVVAESGQKPRLLKRRPFKLMAKDSKADQSSRPARKIKLNRSIFNSGFEGKPSFSFHVKTLEEIKSEKQGSTTTASSITTTSTTVYTCPTPVQSQANVNTSSSTAIRPVNEHISVDTRKVLKKDCVQNLLMPTIQLTRVSAGKYSRSVRKAEASKKHIKLVSEGALRRLKTIVSNKVAGEVTSRETHALSPAKKRRISPIRSPGSEPEVTCHKPSWSLFAVQSSTTTSPEVEEPASPTSLPDPLPPASPPLSLGAESDLELEDKPCQSLKPDESFADARVVISSTEKVIKNTKSFNMSTVPAASHSHSKPFLAKPPCTTEIQPRVGLSATFEDDKLDVMSIMADDDELFLDEKPRPALKRSFSQDSIFDVSENQKKGGDLRSLLKNTRDGEYIAKHPVGDLFQNNSASKTYKIPQVSQSKKNVPAHGSRDARKGPEFSGAKPINVRPGRIFEMPRRNTTGNSASHSEPRNHSQDNRRTFTSGSDQKKSCSRTEQKEVQGKREVPMKGFSPQQQAGLLQGIVVNLEHGNIGEAWLWIKKLDQMNGAVELRMLEETLKMCERVSRSKPSPIVSDAAFGAFEMIKRKKTVKPIDFILVILALARSRRIQDAFSHYQAMKDSKMLPGEEDLERFIRDFCICLVPEPENIIEVIHDVRRLSIPPRKKTNIVNDCVSLLIGSPTNKQKKINSEKWNDLMDALSSPPMSNVQSASQVHTMMRHNNISLSSKVTLQMFKIYKASRSIKLLLDLCCSKATGEILAMQNPPIDVGSIISSPTTNVWLVEACFTNLIKEGTMPSENHLHQFIMKASAAKEFNLIYQFFLKCERSQLSLPLSTLKEMMDVLENWDENSDASVQVYASLRQARKSLKKPGVSPTVRKEHSEKNSGRLANGSLRSDPCYSFQRNGYCHRGDRCRYSHCRNVSRSSVSNDSEHSERESIGEGHSSEDSGKSCEKSTHLNAKSSSPPCVNNAAPDVPVKSFLNGLNHRTANARLPLPGFSGVPLLLGTTFFNPMGINQTLVERPQINPRFQRNPGNWRPRLSGPRKRQPFDLHLPCCSSIPSNVQQPQFALKAANPVPLEPVRDRGKIGRSFSWEPPLNVKQNPRNNVKECQSARRASEDNINNNSGTKFHGRHHQLEMAILSKDWQVVHTFYVECKRSSGQKVLNKDLMVFWNGFAKDGSTKIGQNFSSFVEFLYKEISSGNSCHSSQSTHEVLDQYDVEFIGTVGVSLMERCQALKLFEEGYEVLCTLHLHDIRYFQCGKNFGAYTKDIPSYHVALIAVKLCFSVRNATQSAMVVLQACNYALGEEGEHLSAQAQEYRTRVLHQLFVKLFEEDNVAAAYELVQNFNANASVIGPMYEKVLSHFVSEDEFDQSFAVLDEMVANDLSIDIPPCRQLYEKFMKHCMATQNYDRLLEAVEDVESKRMSVNSCVLQDILNSLSSAEHGDVTKLLFEKCTDLKIYPKTFSQNTPWLCELGCGYSQFELQLIIVKHLEELHGQLMSTSSGNQLLNTIKNFEIALFPRLTEAKSGLKFEEGIQSTMEKNSAIIMKVLQNDLNPPLTISEQSSQQFHKKIVIEKMSLYRWFNANVSEFSGLVESHEDSEVSSQGSITSDVSELDEFP